MEHDSTVEDMERETLADTVMVEPVCVYGFRQHWMAAVPPARFGRVLANSGVRLLPGESESEAGLSSWHEVSGATVLGAVEFTQDGVAFGYTIFALPQIGYGRLAVEVKREPLSG